jgi:signal transduction histidine kinase
LSTILVADDHVANRQYLQTVLGYAGHRVLQASDGAEALQLTRKEHPDLAIIDLLMPEVDGYEFVRQLRDDPAIAKTPVVFLSAAYGEHEAHPLAEAAGVFEFLPKPVEPQRLLDVVASMLGTPLAELPTIPPDYEREHRLLLTGKLAKNTAELELANERLVALARDADERRLQAESLAGDLREAKVELEGANKELRRSNDELQQFAYVASHDLQEPLRSITSFCNLLKQEYSGQFDEHADDYIERIVNGAIRMKQMIASLLSFSRVSCQEQTVFQDVSLQDVIGEAVANLQTAIEESRADVTWGELPTVSGDHGQLVQLLQNLIGNAIVYRSEELPRIRVEARRDGGDWEFTVQDNGIGIASEHHHQVFEIFKRLHTRDQYPGTGIGLAVCQKIVLLHGGQIGVESKAGAGSVFRFTLQAATGEEVDERTELFAASI